MLTDQQLDDAKYRAERMQDGMTVNRNLMARDIRELVDEVKNWRAAFERAKRESGEKKEFGGFAEAFGDVFANVFKGKK